MTRIRLCWARNIQLDQNCWTLAALEVIQDNDYSSTKGSKRIISLLFRRARNQSVGLMMRVGIDSPLSRGPSGSGRAGTRQRRVQDAVHQFVAREANG